MHTHCSAFVLTGPGSRPGSKAAEMQRFLTKLAAVAKRKGQNAFTRGELRVVGTEINLQVRPRAVSNVLCRHEDEKTRRMGTEINLHVRP